MQLLGNDLVESNQRYFHVFNKTLDNKQIFLANHNCEIFINTLGYYNSTSTKLSYSAFLRFSPELQKNYLATHGGEKLVEFYSFNLLPNHYHFLCKENYINNLSRLISNTVNSFTRHFNLTNNREGALFKRGYKKTIVTNQEQFLHLLRYINLNGVSAGLININELRNYNFCSYKYLINKIPHNLCNFNKVYEIFKNSEDFEKFITSVVDYQKSLYLLKQDLKAMGIKHETAL